MDSTHKIYKLFIDNSDCYFFTIVYNNITTNKDCPVSYMTTTKENSVYAAIWLEWLENTISFTPRKLCLTAVL